jgi:hypothetical protein
MRLPIIETVYAKQGAQSFQTIVDRILKGLIHYNGKL